MSQQPNRLNIDWKSSRSPQSNWDRDVSHGLNESQWQWGFILFKKKKKTNIEVDVVVCE